MTNIYLFDVDGTLTPARQPMTSEFAQMFRAFTRQFETFLISGSDYPKICEQVPADIIDLVEGSFGCAGATLHQKGELIYRRKHNFPEPFVTLCKNFIQESPYPQRAGNHLEFRDGMLNVSVIGRDASMEQRAHYYQWDKTSGERKRFVSMIQDADMGYEASAGGQISVDIAPIGWNKSSAKKEVLARLPNASLHFFGDRMGEFGNDQPLADVLMDPDENHHVYPVHSHQDTMTILQKIIDEAS